MLRHWIQKSVNDVRRLIEAGRPDPGTQMREFATAVKALAADEMLTREALCQRLSAADERKLRHAAEAVLTFMHQHSIAQYWGVPI